MTMNVSLDILQAAGARRMSLVQTPAKEPFHEKWQIMRKQFLEASGWFTAYNRGKVLICGRQGYHSININNNSRISLNKRWQILLREILELLFIFML